MELKKGSQTSKPERADVSLNVESAVPQPFTGSRSNAEEIENSRISTDASTLTSDSTSKEFVHVDPKVFSVDYGFVPIDNKPEKEKEYDVSNEALCKLEEYFQSSSSSTSRISDVTHESGIPNVLSTQHPPIQVMDRTGGFDHDRIPASIFAKPTTIMDWSIASNESLFSIQIGKGSLSSDHAFILELDHSEEFSIHEGSYIFKDLNESEESIKSDKLYQPEEVKESGELEICKKTISKENEENPQHFGLGTRISEEPIVNRHYRSISDDAKMKIEGFGNGKANQAQSKQKSPKSSCSNCGCTLCHCFSISSCCYCQRPHCSCKCFSFPTCGCDSWPSCSCKRCCWSDCSCKCFSCPSCACNSWPSCSCKSSCWSDCSCKKLCCRGCRLKCPSFSSCCCKWQTCCCKPSTLECCKNIFCCLSSKSSAKFPSRPRRASNTDAKKWCTCFSCYSCC